MTTGILETVYAPPALSWNTMPVVDTAFCERLIIEVDWSLSVAPSSSSFYVYGTNDSGAAPSVSATGALEIQVAGRLVYSTGSTTSAECTAHASAKGLMIVKNAPRYVTVDGSIFGTTGTCIIRVFGWGK